MIIPPQIQMILGRSTILLHFCMKSFILEIDTELGHFKDE